MFAKACGRLGCMGIIRTRYPSQLKDRRYCSHRCVQLAAVDVRRRGQDEASLRRALEQILAALGVNGPAPPALVRVVRRLRQRSYLAGWTVVTRKVQRAVARGVLVRRSAA